jgi:hypothetical protein
MADYLFRRDVNTTVCPLDQWPMTLLTSLHKGNERDCDQGRSVSFPPPFRRVQLSVLQWHIRRGAPPSLSSVSRGKDPGPSLECMSDIAQVTAVHLGFTLLSVFSQFLPFASPRNSHARPAVFFGIFSAFIKEKLYAGEAIIALCVGIGLGGSIRPKLRCSLTLDNQVLMAPTSSAPTAGAAARMSTRLRSRSPASSSPWQSLRLASNCRGLTFGSTGGVWRFCWAQRTSSCQQLFQAQRKQDAVRLAGFRRLHLLAHPGPFLPGRHGRGSMRHAH